MKKSLLNRRDAISTTLLTACSCSLCPTEAFGQNTFDLGCGIDDIDLLGMKKANRLISLDRLKAILKNSSGNASLDSTLKVALSFLSSDFGVYPSFYFYDDGAHKNARASRSRLNPNSDGTVLFGTTLLEKALEIEGGDAAILAICAHEFAHIAAFKRADELRSVLETAPKHGLELHADFLSGYFLSKYSNQFPTLNLSAVGTVWLSMGSRIPSRPGTHGTVDMRRQAINAGYFFLQDRNDARFDDAFHAATRHIAKL